MGTENMKHQCRSSMKGFIFILFFHTTVAQYAGSSYFMDSSTDCHRPGFRLIGNDGVVNVNGRKPNSPPSGFGQCSLRFQPEDTRNIIDVQFTHFSMSDSNVTLHVKLTGGGIYTLNAGNSKPNQLTSEGGKLTISLTRLDLSSDDYSFGIVIRVYKNKS